MFAGLMQRALLSSVPAAVVAGGGATFDPAHAGDWTLSGGNLTATRNTTAGGFWAEARTTTAKASGTLIFTVNASPGGANALQIGMDDGSGTGQIGGAAGSFGYYSDGRVFVGGGQVFTWSAYGASDVVKVVLDGAGNCAFYLNNGLQGTVTGVVGTLYGAISNGNSTGTSVTLDATGW